MATNTQRKPTYKPSPLQPYVDAGVPPEILLEGHKVQQRPALLRGVAAVVVACGTTLGIAAFTYNQHVKRTPGASVPAQQVMQADDTQKQVAPSQKAP